MAHLYVSFQDDDRIAIFTQDPATGEIARQEDVAVDRPFPAPSSRIVSNSTYLRMRVYR